MKPANFQVIHYNLAKIGHYKNIRLMYNQLQLYSTILIIISSKKKVTSRLSPEEIAALQLWNSMTKSTIKKRPIRNWSVSIDDAVTLQQFLMSLPARDKAKLFKKAATKIDKKQIEQGRIMIRNLDAKNKKIVLSELNRLISKSVMMDTRSKYHHLKGILENPESLSNVSDPDFLELFLEFSIFALNAQSNEKMYFFTKVLIIILLIVIFHTEISQLTKAGASKFNQFKTSITRILPFFRPTVRRARGENVNGATLDAAKKGHAGRREEGPRGPRA
jgi:hypothetical protein